MTRRIALWSLAGFVVACGWVLFVDALTPASRVEILRSRPLWVLIEITAPAALVRHFMLKYYWFIPMNALAYALVGLAFELVRRRSLRHLFVLGLLLTTFAFSQTPDPTPRDGRIVGTVMDQEGKPLSYATVSLAEESLLTLTDAYPVQVKTDLQGHFDSGPTLKHGVYDVYARSEKDGYLDQASVFYQPSDFRPQTVQLFGAKPEANVDLKFEEKAGVLTGKIIDGGTGQPMAASVSLFNVQNTQPNGFPAMKLVQVKNGKFRELIPENTDIAVWVRKPNPGPDATWSDFRLTVRLQSGEVRSLDIRLYKTGAE